MALAVVLRLCSLSERQRLLATHALCNIQLWQRLRRATLQLLNTCFVSQRGLGTRYCSFLPRREQIVTTHTNASCSVRAYRVGRV